MNTKALGSMQYILNGTNIADLGEARKVSKRTSVRVALESAALVI